MLTCHSFSLILFISSTFNCTVLLWMRTNSCRYFMVVRQPAVRTMNLSAKVHSMSTASELFKAVDELWREQKRDREETTRNGGGGRWAIVWAVFLSIKFAFLSIKFAWCIRTVSFCIHNCRITGCKVRILTEKLIHCQGTYMSKMHSST